MTGNMGRARRPKPIFQQPRAAFGSGLPLDEEQYPLMLFMGDRRCKIPVRARTCRGNCRRLIFDTRRTRGE
jgi:hypothetical protein